MNLFFLIFLGVVTAALIAVALYNEMYFVLLLVGALVPALLGCYLGFKDEQGRRRSFDVRDYDIYLDEDDVRARRSHHDIFRYDDEEFYR